MKEKECCFGLMFFLFLIVKYLFMETKFIVNRKDINNEIRCIYCDARPHFYIQNAYVKNNYISEMVASKEFWKQYEKEMANFKILNSVI
jgi:hypothetical protein